MSERIAIIAGASGLVGRYCLVSLLRHQTYQQVYALSRSPLPDFGQRLTTLRVNFDRLLEDDWLPRLPTEVPVDVFCALGTTIRKAGSQEAFRRVDLRYPEWLAKRAIAAGARQFALVSSVGASSSSRTFYLRVKGQLEQSVCHMGFEAVHLFRPSLLVGERQETRRPGEALGIALTTSLQFLMLGPLRKYRPIRAEIVAEAMVEASLAGLTGVNRYHYDDIRDMANRQSLADLSA